MTRLIVALVAVFALCAQAFAAAPAPTFPADMETAWQKQEGPKCQPSLGKDIAMVAYVSPMGDDGMVKVIVITSLNSEQVSVVNLKLFLGQELVEATSYVRKGSSWMFYDHQSQEIVDKMIEHERSELGITKEQYAKCFN
ncbi:MAG: hypothetical protein Q7S52_02420 [bacterium]|nr:hypothetical protein [bacterium]